MAWNSFINKIDAKVKCWFFISLVCDGKCCWDSAVVIVYCWVVLQSRTVWPNCGHYYTSSCLPCSTHIMSLMNGFRRISRVTPKIKPALMKVSKNFWFFQSDFPKCQKSSFVSLIKFYLCHRTFNSSSFDFETVYAATYQERCRKRIVR